MFSKSFPTARRCPLLAISAHHCHEDLEDDKCWAHPNEEMPFTLGPNKTPFVHKKAFVFTDSGCSLRGLSGVDFAKFAKIELMNWICLVHMLSQFQRNWLRFEVKLIFHIIQRWQQSIPDSRIRQLDVSIGSHEGSYVIKRHRLYQWLKHLKLIQHGIDELSIYRRWEPSATPISSLAQLSRVQHSV